MGDPKKLKKNYWTQAHPWNKQAIETGKKLKQLLLPLLLKK